MTFCKNPISVNFFDNELRILVEEYIIMQKQNFTFNGVCSYVLYRAMEEGRTFETGLYASNQLSSLDCKRVRLILDKIIKESRISVIYGENKDGSFVEDSQFEKMKDRCFMSEDMEEDGLLFY